MANGNFESVTRIGYNDGTENRIGVNSASIQPWDPIKMSGEFATVAGAGETIVGVAVSQRNYASDNQTVAQEKLSNKIKRVKMSWLFMVSSICYETNIKNLSILTSNQ